MLTPHQLEDLPQRLIELYSQVENDIIEDMAKRLSKMDFIPSAEWQYKKLIEMGDVHDNIIKKLSGASGISKKELQGLMKKAGIKAVKTDMTAYRKAGLNPTPLEASPALQSVLQAGIDSTNGLFSNLTQTTASTATKQFENALDRAWLQINSGAFSYNDAVRMAVKELTDKGLASITYPSGRRDFLYTAVRRATVTGINQTALKMQEKLADEMETDLVEVTAHAGARTGKGAANHAYWQGKVYSRSGQHKKYLSLKEATGYGTGAGLGGWNCRHSFFPFIEGASEPVYTQAELDNLNAPRYEYNGKKLTEYEATQRQRVIEKNIRKYKREYIGMNAAGLSEDANSAAVNLAKWRSIQKDFIKQTGLKRQFDREKVVGFGRSEAGKVNQKIRKVKALEIKEKRLYNEKRKEIIKTIRSDEIPKTLNIGNQNKHIRASKGYIEGRSYIYGDLKTAQELVNRYHGTGEIRFNDKGKWINKEFISLDEDIGVRVDSKSGVETPTNSFAIHYGKKGSHIIPSRRKDRK